MLSVKAIFPSSSFSHEEIGESGDFGDFSAEERGGVEGVLLLFLGGDGGGGDSGGCYEAGFSF